MSEPEKQPRRRLDQDAYDTAVSTVQAVTAEKTGKALPVGWSREVVDGVLHAARILPPPPEVEADTCTAMWPDANGYWWQCAEEIGHDPQTGHTCEEFWWSADHPEAIPPQTGTAR